MAGGTEPLVVGPGEGRFIDLGDFGMTVKASETETAGVVSILEAEEPPGFEPDSRPPRLRGSLLRPRR